MPIDITNKEEKQITLTGTQIEETLLQSHLSKDAISKIQGLKVSASEIDNVAEFFNNIYVTPEMFGADGTRANDSIAIRSAINTGKY